MNPKCNTTPPKQAKPPKDGVGPRGVPECYYTSRVLNSTGHYVRFIKKLRAIEEETRVSLESSKSKAKDNECIEFFARCDRRNLINKVADRVKLGLESYEEDLKQKKKRLMDLLSADEEMNTRKFTEQAQSGFELLWKEKKERLAYLLAKRKKEQDDVYADTPLSKCSHVAPCIRKIQAKEAEEIQLYQMREKQMRKEAEKETHKMWHEVMMKEAEALAARMEYDAIQRVRRDQEAKNFTLQQIESNRQKRAKEQEMLKQEYLAMKAKFDEDDRKANKAALKRERDKYELGRQKRENADERLELMAKQQAEDEHLDRTWESIAAEWLNEEDAKVKLRIQKQRDLNECNFKIAKMKDRIAVTKFDSDPLILQEGQRLQDAVDLERCQRRLKRKKDTKANQADQQQQGKEKQEEVEKHKATEAVKEEYDREVMKQLDLLVENKQLTDAQARKMHQNDLRGQIEYNKILQERAREAVLNENKKCQIAMNEYQEEIKKMLSRPFFSDQLHPFMKPMAQGLQMREPCPCCGPTYCRHHTPAKSPLPQKKDSK